MNFEQMKLDKRLLDALNKLNYINPSPIQAQSIPYTLNGQDMIGVAQTGTGKTAAFSLPILQRLITNPPSQKLLTHPAQNRARALILTPTRELALQIADSIKNYGRYTKVKYCLLIGGVSQGPQELSLKQGADIVIATPGRLLDLIWQGATNIINVEIFVLDEADRMLDMGFIQDVRRIVEFLPKIRQTMLFTATMPQEILKLSQSILNNPLSITVTPVSSTVESISQWVYLTDYASKPDLLLQIINKLSIKQALVFCRTKHGADKLSIRLTKANVSSASIHGDKSQGARQNALNNFKAGRIKILVATDIAARGIDIDSLPHVINYDLPNEPETYVHRIGRTGRAGKEGTAISLCDFDELEYLKDIQKLIKLQIPQAEDNPYPMTVLKKREKPKRPPRRR